MKLLRKQAKTIRNKKKVQPLTRELEANKKPGLQLTPPTTHEAEERELERAMQLSLGLEVELNEPLNLSPPTSSDEEQRQLEEAIMLSRSQQEADEERQVEEARNLSQLEGHGEQFVGVQTALPIAMEVGGFVEIFQAEPVNADGMASKEEEIDQSLAVVEEFDQGSFLSIPIAQAVLVEKPQKERRSHMSLPWNRKKHQYQQPTSASVLKEL